MLLPVGSIPMSIAYLVSGVCDFLFCVADKVIGMLSMKCLGLSILMIVISCVASAQDDIKFSRLAKSKSFKKYDMAFLKTTADTVLAYQFPSGGWPKNHQWQSQKPTEKDVEERADARKAMSTTGIGSTIDNQATTSEILFLAKLYNATGDVRYAESARRGVSYLVDIQYSNGGWPQFWPSRGKGYDGVPPYADHITFNDNAMENVMRLLSDVFNKRKPFDTDIIDEELAQRCRTAFDKGVQCILDCQIRKDGKLTVWCQQHDEKTLAPAKARAYELPSFTAHGETVGLLMLLMDLPNPSKEIRQSVYSAIDWLNAHALRGAQYEYFTNDDGKRDRRIIQTSDTTVVNWARYYDLETEQPFYCDRDGIKRADFSEVGYERRNGYSWFGDTPLTALKRFAKWSKKNPL